MAQYQVYRLDTGVLVLDLQSDMSDTGSRVVAALLPVEGSPSTLGPRLEPVFAIDGIDYALHTAEMAAVETFRVSGNIIADLSSRDYEISRAIDIVFKGF